MSTYLEASHIGDPEKLEKFYRQDKAAFRGNFEQMTPNIQVFSLLVACLIAGMIMTVITLGLFSAIEMNIGDFYIAHIALSGAVAAPVAAICIIRNITVIGNKLVPVLAGIFASLVLITLLIYLVFFLFTGKDPYNGHEFPLIFNLMLWSGEFGFSTNRIAVLGSSLLVFINLSLILIDLIKVNLGKGHIQIIEATITGYLPLTPTMKVNTNQLNNY